MENKIDDRHENCKVTLTPGQIANLARPIANCVDAILEFYKNPENERSFQEWHLKRYGFAAAEGQ